MRRFLVPLLVVVIAAAVFFVVRRNDERDVSPLESAATAPKDSTPLTPGALDAPETASNALSPVGSPTVGRTHAPATGEDVTANSRRVRGSVRLAAPCADPSAEALSMSRECGVYDYLEAQRADGTDHGTLKVLARTLVDAQGRFTLALEPDQTTAHVLVVGHYWSSRSTSEVSLDRDIVIAVDCGARIEAELTVPPELAARASDLEGLHVIARPTIGGAKNELRGFGRSQNATIDKGRFAFGPLDPQSAWSIDGTPKTLASFGGKITDLVAGRTVKISIPITAGGIVRGVVRSKDGAPVASAEVSAKHPGSFFGFDAREVRETKSAADGSFELAAVAAGKLTLVASASGKLESEPSKLELADGATIGGVEIVLDAGATVAGIVLWPDGKPASGADVKAGLDVNQRVGMNAFNARRGTDGSTMSGEDGRFEISGLGAGPFTLSARALPGEAAATIEAATGDKSKLQRELELTARIEDVKAGAKDVRIQLRAPIAVAGRAVDTLDAPIVKFRVVAQSSGNGPLGDLGREKVEKPIEDEHGAFRISVPTSGKWKVRALADGYADTEPIEIELPRADTDGELVLKLEKQCIVSGVVHDPRGAPVANADVSVEDGKPGFLRGLEGKGTAGHAKSDGEGRFRLDRLKSGRIVVVADAEDRARSEGATLDLAVGEEKADVVLTLRDGGTLSGEVYEDGKPLAGYLVQTTELKAYAQEATFTDGEGRFRVEHLEPGGYQVVALPASGDDGASDAAAMMSKMKMTMTDVREGEETHVVIGAKPAAPVKLHGRVTHAGEPYGGATLSFVASGKNALAALKIVQISAEGTYDVVLDKPGDYVATVQRYSGGMQQQSATEFSCKIPEAEDHALDFAIPTGRISGRVSNVDGEPAGGVRVSVLTREGQRTGTMWGGQYHELATDSDGRYDVQALDPGKYAIAVGGMEMGGLFGSGSKHGRELRDIDVKEGEWQREVDFRLKTPATVNVSVVDENGVAVAEAAVFARDERGQLLDRFSMISSDASGIAHYGGLAPGKYFFSARKDARASAESAVVAIDVGETKEARVPIVAATRLLVKITDDSQPTSARLSVVDAAGREHAGVYAITDLQEMFAQDGFQPNEMRVGPLAPGKYVVRANGLEGKKAEKSFTLSGAPEKKISLELK